MDYNSPKFKKKVKNLQGKDLKTSRPQQPEKKVDYDITKLIGPYNTSTGYPEEQKVKTQPEKPKEGILNKIGSSIKKYIPLKKFMKEQYVIDGAWWLLHQQGNQSGDNPIVLPGVPQGGGGVHGQQPTNPNY